MKLLCTTALTTALMTAAVMSITSPAQAQARLAWWGWPGLVGYPGYGYGTGYTYPAYAYGYGTGYGYPLYQSYSSSGGYGMWESPWWSAASHPVIRRPIAFSRPRIRPMYAAGAGVRRHWQ
jgi:hypothetical protein